MKLVVALFTNLFVLLPTTAYAADWSGGSELRQLVGSAADFIRYLLQDFLPPVGGAIVVLMVIWGGIQYITGQKENGKKTIFAAIIGAIIVILAYVIIEAINQNIR